jgi:hypothetical protein
LLLNDPESATKTAKLNDRPTKTIVRIPTSISKVPEGDKKEE